MDDDKIDEWPILQVGHTGSPLRESYPVRQPRAVKFLTSISSQNKVHNWSKKEVSFGKHEHLERLGNVQANCTTTSAGNSSAATYICRMYSNFLESCPKGIFYPHSKYVRRWNKLFVICCLIAIFLDPLFFFLLSVDKERKCIVLDQKLTYTVVVLRSITDMVYFLHMLLESRLAYVPKGLSIEAGDLIADPKQILLNYLKGWFLFDLVAVVPLPQIMMLVILPHYLGKPASANYAKNILRVILLLQSLPRVLRLLPFFTGSTSSGFIFETAWANFVINLLIYLLAAHVVGSCWYLFGLQRVNKCLRDVCRSMNTCVLEYLDCGTGDDVFLNNTTRNLWRSDTSPSGPTSCFLSDPSFNGIYDTAVKAIIERNPLQRYIYSLFWGFQQISTLAGNQTPSLFVWEVVFTMIVIGLGLLLLTLLIGNMQNFLQSLGRRQLEMQLRRYDVEKWMARRELPLEIRRKVIQFERFSWAATRGVDENQLLEDLPEDLHRKIRREFFVDLVKKVYLLKVLEEIDKQLIDAIFERLHQKLYIGGCELLRRNTPVHRMHFIVHGILDSEGPDGTSIKIKDGDICGEELLTWYLEHAYEHAMGQQQVPQRSRTGQKALSTRTVVCTSSVEAFSLEAQDLEEVTRDFKRYLRNAKVQAAIRYISLSWRTWAAITIQVAWKYRKRKLGATASIGQIPTTSGQQQQPRGRRPTHRYHH